MTTDKLQGCLLLVLMSITLLLMGAFAISSSLSKKHQALDSLSPDISNYHEHLFAILVTTNLVSIPCKCGYCTESARVPEHIGKVGCDHDLLVSTQYLPIVKIIKK